MGTKKAARKKSEDSSAAQTPVRMTRSSARKLSSGAAAEASSESSSSSKTINTAWRKVTRRSLKKPAEEDVEDNSDNIPNSTSLFKAAEDSFQEPEELNSEVDYDVAASAFRDIKMEPLSEPPSMPLEGDPIKEEPQEASLTNENILIEQVEACQLDEIKQEVMSSEADRVYHFDVFEEQIIEAAADTTNENEEHSSEAVQVYDDAEVETELDSNDIEMPTNIEEKLDVDSNQVEPPTVEEKPIVSNTVPADVREERPNIRRPFTPPPQLVIENSSSTPGHSALLSPSKIVDLNRSPRPPVDPEKQKRLNAELQRLAQEISFENTLKPVRLQQIEAFNPFKQFTAPAPAAKPVDTNWADLAKMWMKSAEDSSKASEQLEEIEAKRKQEEERIAEEKRRAEEEETRKKFEQAKAIADKFNRDLAILSKVQKEVEAPKHAPAPPKEEKLVIAARSEINDKKRSSSPRPRKEHSRSHSRRRSSSRSRSNSQSRDKKSPMRDRKRSRSRDRGGYRDRHIRDSYLPRNESNNSRDRRPYDRRNPSWRGDSFRHSRSPDARPERKRRSRSPLRSPLRNRTPLRSQNSSSNEAVKEEAVVKVEEKESSVREEKVEPPPPIPFYQTIEELIYLDDKVTKNGKRVKRAMERTAECDCHVKNLNCSDDRCLNRQMLLECRMCRAPNCQNQKLRLKQYAEVEAFYTGPFKGFGLRAKERIRRNQFIIEYIGEVVTNDIFNERIKKYSKDPNHTHHYIFEMGRKLIDATVKGNVSRFINHSCEPNAVSLKWAVPKSPQDCSRIGFFANRDILPGEEITFDYHFQNYGKKAQSCHCGAVNCKGTIGDVVDDGEDSDEDDEDEDEEEDDDEKEPETAEEKMQRELEEEQREWESQRKINEIISAAKIPQNKTAAWANRFVKNLVNIVEVGYRIRVLSFVKNTEHHFYQLLKRKSLFDVFASWLSPSDWSKDDMELKLEVVRLLADSETDSSHVNQATGWTDLCCQSIEKLANAEVPSVLAVRDTMDSMLDILCGKKDDDEEDSEKMTSESLFESVRNTAKELIESKKFADEKRKCAVSKFRIPKKVKQEREAAAENPASAYEQQAKKEDVHRSERRENFYFRAENFRSGNRYDSSQYNQRYGTKRRYDSQPYATSRHLECKRSRVETYDPARKHERFDRYRDQYMERRRHDEGGRPRTPPLPERPPSRGLLGDGPIHLGLPVVEPLDMELSDSCSPGPEVVPMPSCSTPSIVTENSVDLRCPSIQDRTFLGPPANLHLLFSWILNTSEDSVYQHLRAFSVVDRKKAEDAFIKGGKIVRKIWRDVERDEKQKAEIEAQKTRNMLIFADAAQKAMYGKPVPKPPPPPPPPNRWFRVKNRSLEAGSKDYYYFSKDSNETVWELPEGEGFDDYEEVAPQPDSSADVVEIRPRGETLFRSASRASLGSRSDERPSSRNSLLESSSRPESRNSVASSKPENVKDERKKHSHDPAHGSSRAKREEFGHAIQKTVQPVIWEALRSIMFATTEKRNWLLKQVTKEMVKRESMHSGCTWQVTSDVKKRIISYTTRFMARKCENGGQDLFKGYKPKDPTKN